MDYPKLVRCAVVGTYPPTPCGLATFSQALVSHASRLGAEVDVVRIVDHHEPFPAGEVVHHLVHGAPRAASEAAATLNGYDLVVLQHEYGIYPGVDGDGVLAVLDRVRVPVMAVLHTVLVDPTPHQRKVLQAVVEAADGVVTMTRTARRRLLDGYAVGEGKVHVIPHGAAEPPPLPPVLASGRGPNRWSGRGLSHRLTRSEAARRPVILTWGLLGVGKGIEWGIEAMADLQDLDPSPIYVVAGQTHPRVLEREGEAYRRRLQRRARSHGIADMVVFDDRYLGAEDLHRLVQAADVVLLPYDSREQVTSGVLIEAVAAGKPVVSTGFPHAVELLADGAGLLVDQRDPAAIAAALRRVLTEPGLAARMSAEADRLAPGLSWQAVAGAYLSLGSALVMAKGRTSVRTPTRAAVAVAAAG